jgi:hypothetical protein
MNLQLMAQVADLLGAFAIIVSLVYVALQVKQNTLSIRAENYAHALDRVSEMQSKLAQNPEITRMMTVGLADPLALPRLQRVQFSWLLYEMFGAFEFMYLQSRNAALPADVWRRWSDTMDWWLQFPGIQLWWRSQPAPFIDSFASYVDSRIGQPLGNPEREQRWQQFLRAAPRPKA